METIASGRAKIQLRYYVGCILIEKVHFYIIRKEDSLVIGINYLAIIIISKIAALHRTILMMPFAIKKEMLTRDKSEGRTIQC